MDELQKIPPVTRAFLGMAGLVTLTPLLQLSSVRTWYLSWPLIWYRCQVWRLFTPFFYAGKDFQLLMNVFILYRNSSDLENSRFSGRSSQYAWCMLVNAAAILALNVPLQTPFLLGPLLSMLIYFWARDNPSGQVNFFGFITIPSRYVPQVYILVDLITGGLPSAIANATGLLAAHAWLIIEAHAGSDPPPRGGRQSLQLALARFLTQAPGILRQILPDSLDPTTGNPTPTRGPGGGAWDQRGRALNSLGSGTGDNRIPSFLRNWGAGSSSNAARNGPTRDDMLAATERRLRAQADKTIVGQNLARNAASARAGLAPSGESARAARSTAVPSSAPRSGSSGVHSLRQSDRQDDPDFQDANSSGGTVAEQRRAHARQPSDPTRDQVDHWPGQGQRLG